MGRMGGGGGGGKGGEGWGEKQDATLGFLVSSKNLRKYVYIVGNGD